MWDAAGEFSRGSRAQRDISSLDQDSRCPFCQQTIGPEAATRLKHFAEYVSSEAQAALKRAETIFRHALSQIHGTIGRTSATSP